MISGLGRRLNNQKMGTGGRLRGRVGESAEEFDVRVYLNFGGSVVSYRVWQLQGRCRADPDTARFAQFVTVIKSSRRAADREAMCYN